MRRIVAHRRTREPATTETPRFGRDNAPYPAIIRISEPAAHSRVFRTLSHSHPGHERAREPRRRAIARSAGAMCGRIGLLAVRARFALLICECRKNAIWGFTSKRFGERRFSCQKLDFAAEGCAKNVHEPRARRTGRSTVRDQALSWRSGRNAARGLGAFVAERSQETAKNSGTAAKRANPSQKKRAPRPLGKEHVVHWSAFGRGCFT